MARRGLSTDTIGLAEARRIALYAQGFANAHRERKPTWPAVSKAVDALQLLQIDSVNVLVRSHYLPLFSRLGNYDVTTLDKRWLTNKARHFFECWAHEASLVPLSLHPLMRWRMHRAQSGVGTYKHMNRFGKEERTFLNATMDFIRKNGPCGAGEIPSGGKGQGGWWGWSKGKLAAETLFDQGLLTTATRRGFERIYDLPERVIPESVLTLPTPAEPDAFRSLIAKSGEALGIGTEQDLRDYFRLPVAESKKAITENVESGVLRSVTVEGWRQPAYLHAKAKLPRAAGGNALLTPFDPLVWNRERAERLFSFHYRIELYTPQEKRKFGYYVLPFLHGEKLSARLCMKSDRATNTLRVNAAHIEQHADAAETAAALAEELQLMAKWLGLATVEVARSGGLARHLAAAMAQ